jgi:predicted nucleic acid-binding Zn ribbon protein
MTDDHAARDASHAPRHDPLATDPAGTPTPPETDHAACVVCGQTLRGRRPEARCCSGRCRNNLARRRRRDDLRARLARAERALTEAAAALEALRQLAGLDATLELGRARS